MTDPRIGAGIEGVDTPSLLLDLSLLEANIARILGACRAAGVAWRPHVKAHKCPELAKRQIAAGAIGVTCAKLGEAEVMAASGITDILVANQVVGPLKIARLLALRRVADVIVAVDGAENIAELGAAFAGAPAPLRVVVEIDSGSKRAGAATPEAAAALAGAVAAQPGLRFAGVMTWEGHTTRIADQGEKQAAVTAALNRLTDAAAACRAAGHAVPIVSCGGTGTLPFCTRHPGVTEIQAGGGILGDVRYSDVYRVEVAHALTLLAGVTSRPTPTRIVLDAGKKALSSDTEMPRPLGLPPFRSLRFSAEHATIELEQASHAPRPGDRVAFIPGYTDTTVFLHEEIIAMRHGRVEGVWPIAARGKLR
jgi:D-serine deaminase-like pyridoxal phosphate-dependent protein